MGNLIFIAMNYRQFRPNFFNSFFKKTQQSRFFTSAAHLQRLRIAQKNIYGFQCASFFGLQNAGSLGMLSSMLQSNENLHLCTLAQCSADDLLSILKNELCLDVSDDDTLRLGVPGTMSTRSSGGGFSSNTSFRGPSASRN